MFNLLVRKVKVKPNLKKAQLDSISHWEKQRSCGHFPYLILLCQLSSMLGNFYILKTRKNFYILKTMAHHDTCGPLRTLIWPGWCFCHSCQSCLAAHLSRACSARVKCAMHSLTPLCLFTYLSVLYKNPQTISLQRQSNSSY